MRFILPTATPHRIGAVIAGAAVTATSALAVAAPATPASAAPTAAVLTQSQAPQAMPAEDFDCFKLGGRLIFKAGGKVHERPYGKARVVAKLESTTDLWATHECVNKHKNVWYKLKAPKGYIYEGYLVKDAPARSERTS